MECFGFDFGFRISDRIFLFSSLSFLFSLSAMNSKYFRFWSFMLIAFLFRWCVMGSIGRGGTHIRDDNEPFDSETQKGIYRALDYGY